jgi:hypothetical protein
MATSDSESVTVDLPSWLSRATLDAIGEGVLEDALPFLFPLFDYSDIAAFDYDFGALEDKDNEVSRSYRNFL